MAVDRRASRLAQAAVKGDRLGPAGRYSMTYPGAPRLDIEMVHAVPY